MNTRNIIITTVCLLAVSGSVGAQSQFNTISELLPHYRAQQTSAYNKKEASPEGDTSTVGGTMTDSCNAATVPLPKQSERTRYPLSVSYPLRSKLVITSPYGWRKDPLNRKKSTFHSGVDLRAKHEPVYAMLPGVVVNTGYEPRGGNFISLKHGGIKVTYCHLSLISVYKGETVYAGQPIGVSGNSGTHTTGEHLHLSVKDASNKPICATDLLDLIAKNLK